MSRTLERIAIAAVFLMFGVGALADQYAGPGFSGTAFVTSPGGGTQRLGPVYIDQAGFRMTIQNGGQSFGSLIRWGDSVAYSLMLDQRMYIKVPPAETGFDRYEARPCLHYRRARQLGVETIGGRKTVKWHCIGAPGPVQGDTSTDRISWYDPELAFEIKAVNNDGGTFEIREIMVGRQDPALFEIPAGFEEFDMNAWIRQQQQ